MTLGVKKVWDLPTRILHWTIAGAVLLNLFILESGDPPHQWAGYTAFAAFFLRFIWGFIGGELSRFRSFPIHPREVFSFSKSLALWKPREYPGHNPLASLAYFAIWACVAGLGISGWMMGLDRYWGEEWLEEIHANIGLALQVLLGIHLFGVAIDACLHRRKSWMAMIDGKKR